MHPNSAIVRNEGPARENVDFYAQNGYLIAPQLLTPEEIGELNRETAEIFRGNRGQVEGLMPVSGLSDADVLKRYIAIHFPHKLSPLIREYLRHPRVVEILTKIVSPNVKCMQSMLFVKGPGKAGQAWHQDEYYIPTRDRSLVGAWIAIDHATIENGCLWIIPGSHRTGVVSRRIPGTSPEFAESDTLDISAYTSDQIVPVEVQSGSIVFFHGYLFHSSRRNRTTDRFRTALVNHYMSAESTLPWDQDRRLPATEDLRDIVMVAGVDPYEWKGVVDISKPYLRSETPTPKGER